MSGDPVGRDAWVDGLLTPPPASYELHPAVASLIVRMDVGLGNEGIGPRAPYSGSRPMTDAEMAENDHPAGSARYVRTEIPREKFPDGDDEPTDREVIRQAYVTLGLDPDLDYGS